MDINNFSSFFQFITGITLIYSGSEDFRDTINQSITRLTHLPKELLTLVTKLIVSVNRIQTLRLVDGIGPLRKDDFGLVKLVNEANSVISSEDNFRNFPVGFKSIYLITGLFCLLILLLGGFQQFFICSEPVNIILLFLNLILFYNLFIFARSFSKRYVEQNLPLEYPFGFIAICVIVAILWVTVYPGLESHINLHKVSDEIPKFKPHSDFPEIYTIILSLLTSLSPFLLHIIRVLIHKYIFKSKFNRLILLIEKAKQTIGIEEELLFPPPKDQDRTQH